MHDGKLLNKMRTGMLCSKLFCASSQPLASADWPGIHQYQAEVSPIQVALVM